MELFSFLQSELAKEKDPDAKVSSLFASCVRSLGVFPRDLWLRLGVAPPPHISTFDDTEWFPAPATLPWLALEAVVRDDMPLLYFLLTKGLIDVGLKLPTNHAEFPYMVAGDSLVKYADRFGSFWSKLLLVFWRRKSVKAMTKGSDADERRLSKTIHSKIAHPTRRGSYAILKRDLQKSKDETLLLLTIHFSDGRTINFETSSAKKARHVVYELGEKENVDLEAWALQDTNMVFLEDYKTLKQSNVRSGDELTLALKYKALQFKTVTVLLHLCKSDSSYSVVSVPINPFGTVKELQTRLGDYEESDVFLPFVVQGKLVSVLLNSECCLASYGDVGGSTWLYHGVSVRRPLLVVQKGSIMRYGIDGVCEPDSRVATWMSLMKFDPIILKKKQNDVEAALQMGVPSCVRMMLWDRMLNLTELTNANFGLFEVLADTEMLNAEEENVFEKIERDLDRTLPYHPLFRTKLGKGQTDMLKVLKAFSIYDKEIGYCQGLNFIVATLLTVFDAARAFWALTIMLKKFGVRSNFTPGMQGLHAMLGSFDDQVRKELPDLHNFFEENGIIIASFATEWFLTLFSACIVSGGDSTLHIWDTLMFKGVDFLPALGLALLKGAEAEMMSNPEKAIDVLRNLFKEEDSGKKVAEAVVLAFAKKRK